jgi:hypothetical protein
LLQNRTSLFALDREITLLIQDDGERAEAAFIQSQGAEDLLHLRLDAVALDELPRLLPDLSILTGRWYRTE